MYAVTSMPFESRTRATFRSAEFGFLGVIVLTTVQTPRFCGQPCMAGCFGLDRCGCRGERINWLIVGIPNLVWPGGHTRPATHGQSLRPKGFGYSSRNTPARPGGCSGFYGEGRGVSPTCVSEDTSG